MLFFTASQFAQYVTSQVLQPETINKKHQKWVANQLSLSIDESLGGTFTHGIAILRRSTRWTRPFAVISNFPY